MPRNVKCRLCGKLIPINAAYKITKDNKNAYFCNELEYETAVTNADDNGRIVRAIKYILNRPIDKLLSIEINLWVQIKDRHTLSCFLIDKRDYLRETIERKEFETNSHETRYLSAVIKNALPKYKLPKPDNIKQVPDLMPVKDIYYKPKRSIDDIVGGDDNG